MTRRKRTTKPAEFIVTMETKEEKPAPKEEMTEELNIESIVSLICAYTKYSKGEARNLITGVVSGEKGNLLADVIDWCTHIKHIEAAQIVIDAVSQGAALVQRDGTHWRTVSDGTVLS